VPKDQREAFIRKHCSDSATVEREVRRLIEAHDDADEFLEEPVLGSSSGDETPALYGEGDVLAGRFRINKLLGRGGMGEVYEALDTELNETIAIKTLPAASAEDPGTIDRFRTEVLRSRLITHSNVCRVHDFFTHKLPDGREFPFFTMKLLRGQTLATWIETHGPFTPGAALPLLRQMAMALQAAHEVGLVHRDFKPANIFLSPADDGAVQAIVTDFGIAGETGTQADSGNKPATLSSSLSMLAGTPAYMAPEQMAGLTTSRATDVYALGLVAYEMLTGQPLHAGGTALACTLKRINAKNDGLRSLDSRIPRQWQLAIDRCLRAKQEERFVKPLDFIEAIEGPKRKENPPGRKSSILAAALLGAVAGAAIWFMPRNAGPTQAASSVVVLPFETAAADPQLAFLGEGFAEELTHALTAYPNLHVAAHSSAYRISTAKTSWADIGKQLGVQMILTGTVRRTEDRMRVVARLVEADTGRQRWSQIYDRDYRQVFTIQSEITQQLAKIMSLQPAQTATEREPTANMAAYDHYLKGRYFWNKRSEVDLKKGLQEFQQAIRLDPKFASAHTGVADSYLIPADYGMISASEVQPKIREALQQSLSLDPGLAESHATLGLFSSLIDWDQSAAERAFQKALALKPALMRAHFWYGVHLMRAGRLSEALREAETARRLDPVSLPTVVFVGWVHYYKRDYNKALAVAKQAIEMDRTYAYAHQLMAQSYAAMGKHSLALRSQEQVVSADEAAKLRRRAQVISLLPSMRDETRQVASRLEALSSDRQSGYLAMIYAGLGDRDKMFEWINRALEARDPALTLVNVAPETQPYRQDPRFRQALHQVGFE
ncbi:MAG TPA: protein kinase, partial [Bryobacteraceae bacterium]|nr:protein kinase [Bryobacteraceae bacterium]